MDLEKKLSTIWRTIIEGGSTTISSWQSLVGRILWQFEGNQTPACNYHFLRIRLRLVSVAKMDLQTKLSTILRTIIEGGSTTISSWKTLVGWVLWHFEGNSTQACKYHFLRVRLWLVCVAKMDLEKKHCTIWRTIIEVGSTTTFSWMSLVGWVLWHFEGNSTQACKYHFLRVRLSLVWVAKMDLGKKHSTIWRTIIEGDSTTISSWKCLDGWVLWQFEANQILACKYHFLGIRLRVDWVAKMDLEMKLRKIWRAIIEGGSTTTFSWKSLVGWVLWQFEGNPTQAYKYHFLRIRLRLACVATMDSEKKLSTIWRKIIEGVPHPFLFGSHWWVEFYGNLKRIKLHHVNTICWGHG